MKCVCCNKPIKAIYGDISQEESVFKVQEKRNGNTIVEIKAENRMWLDGVVGNISAGYGSSKDGDQYVIAICDDCITEKIEDGSMAHTGNYMSRTTEVLNIIEENKKKWRRNNNLDELL